MSCSSGFAEEEAARENSVMMSFGVFFAGGNSAEGYTEHKFIEVK